MKEIEKEIIGSLLDMNIKKEDIESSMSLIKNFLEKYSKLFNFHDELIKDTDMLKALSENLIKELEL
jgi:hypothetical protein